MDDSSLEFEECRLDTKFGPFKFRCYNFGIHEDDNVLMLTSPKPVSNAPFVRIQSACFTSEIFRSTDCDCHEQLERSLEIVSREGGSVFYVLQDGRGAGIFQKVKGLKLGETRGLDTADAYKELNIPADPRSYERITRIMISLGMKSIKLLTNNPRKVEYLRNSGIKVERVALQIPPTAQSLPYLLTKKNKMGHMLDYEKI